MKKYTLLILVLLSFTLNICRAQTQGYVEYEYYHPRATPVQRLATLNFDGQRSLFVFARDGYEQLANKVGRQEGNTASAVVFGSDPIGSVYYRDFDKKQMIYRTVPTKLIQSYLVSDTWTTIPWQIAGDRKKIGKFNCRKATANFRGRAYTAWFTEEIPVSAGPWKLFGLPGLILEATDSENMFRAYAKKIVYPAANPISIVPPDEGKKMSVKEYAAFMDNAAREAMEKMKSKMPREIASSFVIMENKDDPKNRKFRDEKAYEWEVN